MSRATTNQGGKEIQQAPEKADFLKMLEQMKGEIAKVLPESVNVERVIRMVRSLYQTNPDLRGCAPGTILATVMKAAELNLELGGGLKQAWALPFRNSKTGQTECQFVVGYQGVLELARRSGLFRSIDARTVLDSDQFSLEYTPKPLLSHRPDLHETGAEIGAYAYATLINGEQVVEWMSRKTIEKIRAGSKQQHVWNAWWGEKAKNAVLKRMLKRQPLSIEVRRALDEDDDRDAMDPNPPRDQTAIPAPTRSAGLAARLAPRSDWRVPVLDAEQRQIEGEPTAEDYGGEVEETTGREPGEEG